MGGEHGADSTAALPLPPDARFLVIRFSSLGDVVKCTVLPRRIKAAYPRGHLTFVTTGTYLELIRDNPYVDRAIGLQRGEGLSGLLRLARELGRERFDLVADVHHSLRSRVLRAYIRAPRTAYSKRTLQRLLLIHFRLNTYRYDAQGHAAGKEQDFLAGLLPYGVRDDGRGTELNLRVLEGDAALHRRFSAELEAIDRWRADGKPVVGVAPVAAWDLKRWPMSHWKTLLERYVSVTGGGVLVFGGPTDTDAAALAAALGPAAVSLVGRASLLESAWFAARADMMIAHDTGMSHIAEAVGRDVLVLFGPTSRELGYFPVRSGSVVLERALLCRPCTRTGQGRCTHPLPKACLALISPEEVLATTLAMLEAHPPV